LSESGGLDTTTAACAAEGAILHEPGGFGRDPLIHYPPFDCSFGEAGAREKFSVSHRGQALRAMLAALQGYSEPA
jgi:XTP/dITP diphosphohydrolase